MALKVEDRVQFILLRNGATQESRKKVMESRKGWQSRL